MVNRFDLLPLYDIVHEMIFPMLDYESRIQFNRCLLPKDRHRAKFTTLQILSHELYVVSMMIKNVVVKISTVIGFTPKERVYKKAKLIVTLLNMLDKRGSIMMKYYPKFKETVVEKLTSFTNPDSEELAVASPYFKQKIRKLSFSLLPNIIHIVPVSLPSPMKPIDSMGRTVFPTVRLL